MRAITAALLITVAPSSAALAADMGTPYSKAPALAAYDWSGFYVGGHIGGGSQTTTFADPTAEAQLLNCCILLNTFVGPSAATNATGTGFLGGVQAGTMYQIGRLVVGADFDWSSTSLKGTGSSQFVNGGFGGLTGPATETYNVNTKWTATATTTVGIAHDRFMIYGKGGVAFENVSYGLGVAGIANGFGGPGGPFTFASTASDTVAGWTVGTGFKWAFSNDWFLNAEYDYMDFGSKAQNFSGVANTIPVTFTPNFNQHISEVKIGLNYKFGPGIW
jgi:outer membrane immunogenic protein